MEYRYIYLISIVLKYEVTMLTFHLSVIRANDARGLEKKDY